jgi:hypothetical protein
MFCVLKSIPSPGQCSLTIYHNPNPTKHITAYHSYLATSRNSRFAARTASRTEKEDETKLMGSLWKHESNS